MLVGVAELSAYGAAALPMLDEAPTDHRSGYVDIWRINL